MNSVSPNMDLEALNQFQIGQVAGNSPPPFGVTTTTQDP